MTEQSRREKIAKKYDPVTEPVESFIEDAVIQDMLNAGYLPVEPVQLEVLGDEEIMKATHAPVVLSGHRRITQDTLAHNEAKFGQLYRAKLEDKKSV